MIKVQIEEKNVLVFGASGYIGGYLKKLLQTKCRYVAGTFRSKNCENIADEKMFFYDLKEEGNLETILGKKDWDILISCLRGDFQQQIDAHQRMAEYVKRDAKKKLIFFSTANVFDGAPECGHYEKDTPKSVSTYGTYKIACEKMIQEELGTQGIILRIPEVWGENCPRILQMKSNIQNQEPVPVYKNYDFNYVTPGWIGKWIVYILEHDLYGIFHVGTKDTEDYAEFRKRVIKERQLGKAQYAVQEECLKRQIQAVLPGRMDIPAELQFSIDDILKELQNHISLKERTKNHVKIYFQKTQDSEIKRMLPSTVQTEEDALNAFEETQRPDATSYGRTIYYGETYVGDIWCYNINTEESPNGMLSYCIFDKTLWNKGIATQALALFLEELQKHYQVKELGAFLYAANAASRRVLEKNGFVKAETIVEDGVESFYYEWKL